MAIKKTVQRIAISYYKTKFNLLAAVSKRKAAEKAFELFCTPQSRKNKKPAKIFESGEKLHFTLEGNIVRGWRFNDPAENKVLILHGWESSVTNFDKYISLFVKKGYEVLAFDAPAHGGSGGKMITAPLYKDMIKEIHETVRARKFFCWLIHSAVWLYVLRWKKLNQAKNTGWY